MFAGEAYTRVGDIELSVATSWVVLDDPGP